MRTWQAILGLTVLLLRPLPGQSQVPATNATDELVTIDVQSVPLEEMVHCFMRMSKVNMQHASREFREAKPVTLRCTNQPWRSVLQSILADRGFLLVADPGGRGAYTIVAGDTPCMAVRFDYSSAAVSLADSLLADIKSNNVAGATARLEAFAEDHRRMLSAIEAARTKPKK